MRLPDWRNLVLHEGTIAEPTPDDGRLILWLAGNRERGFQHWERISNVLRAEITVTDGVCATAATSVRARQRVQGRMAKFFHCFRSATGDHVWVLPNGESVEQYGDRQTDLMLVWAADDRTVLDEVQIKARWPACARVRKMGSNLFLVSGIEAHQPGNEPATTPLRDDPRLAAAQLVDAARKNGDRRKQAMALTDLGILCLQQGQAQESVAHLEEALAIARQIGERSRESDVLGNLGLAVLAVGQPQRALELLEQELAYARSAQDRFAETNALDHLGLAYSVLRQPARALEFYEGALALARTLGDRHHEADLLWLQGIQHAGLGQRDEAIAKAEAAIGLMENLGKPEARWFTDSLRRYRAGENNIPLSATHTAEPAVAPGGFSGGPLLASAWAVGPAAWPAQEQPAAAAGLLQMAYSAAKSMTKFIGSGLVTVSPPKYRRRLQTCTACEHHTGLRCKLCGCFTKAKAWLPHEDCPIGRWPA